MVICRSSSTTNLSGGIFMKQKCTAKSTRQTHDWNNNVVLKNNDCEKIGECKIDGLLYCRDHAASLLRSQENYLEIDSKQKMPCGAFAPFGSLNVGPRDGKCHNPAKYLINGEAVCKLHAGYNLLKVRFPELYNDDGLLPVSKKLNKTRHALIAAAHNDIEPLRTLYPKLKYYLNLPNHRLP